MGQLVLGVAGAVVGSFIPGVGTALGWGIGSALGGMFFGPKGNKVSQPLGDLRVPGTDYGQPIPYVEGHPAVSGQYWWNTDKRPITTSTTTGGKGGGAPEQEVETTVYEIDCLIGLTDNEIAGITRIWWNGDLVWSNLSTSPASTINASESSERWTRMTVYTGAPDQLPDPTYEAAVGLGNAPAYRHRGTVFFEGLQLGQSGQIPNLLFEVSTSSTQQTGFHYTPPAGFSRIINTWDPNDHDGDIELSNGNLTATKKSIGGGAFTPYSNVRATEKDLEGKVYCEFTYTGQLSDILVGIWSAGDDITMDVLLGIDPGQTYALFHHTHEPYYHVGDTIFSPTDTGRADAETVGTVIMCAVDFDSGQMWFGVDGVWNDGGDPAAGTNPAIIDIDSTTVSWAFCFRTANQAETDPPTSVTAFFGTADTQTPLCEPVADVVSRLCLRAGLTADQFDVTALSSITTEVCALAISQIAPTRSVLERLMTRHFFEMTVSDKIYFRPRGGSTVRTIEYEELAAAEVGDTMPEPLAIRLMNDIELPARIAISYHNLDNDHQVDTQHSDRLISSVSETVDDVQIALGMTPAQAKGVADTMLLDQATALIGTSLHLLGEHAVLEPTDVIRVNDKDGSSFRLRLVKKTDRYPLITFDAVLDDPSVLFTQGITSTDYTSSTTVVGPVDTIMELLDIPILRDMDNDAGFYVATKGEETPYPGSAIFKSANDVDFDRVATVRESAVFGNCTTILGDWTGPRVFDEVNTVTVNVGDATLISSTRDILLDNLGVNLMMIGDEIIQFINATLVTTGVYTLSRLLRGCRGTEWAMTGHEAGERCVLLRPQGMRRVLTENAELGLVRHYKGVTLGRSLSSATSEEFTNSGIGLKPFAPFDLRASRDASNNVTLTAQRRSRLSVRMIGSSGISVPLGEAEEQYQWIIYASSVSDVAVRTITSGVPSASYTAAEQTADGLTPGNPISVGVVQMSQTVGRGYEHRATV